MQSSMVSGLRPQAQKLPVQNPVPFAAGVKNPGAQLVSQPVNVAFGALGGIRQMAKVLTIAAAALASAGAAQAAQPGKPANTMARTVSAATDQCAVKTKNLESLVQENKITAEQVTAYGIPQRLTELMIPLKGKDAHICRPDGFTLEAAYLDPQDGKVKTRLVPVTAQMDGTTLKLIVTGPVSKGSKLTIAANTIDVDGNNNNAGTLALKQGVSIAESALWFKAFQPTSHSFFTRGSYPHNTPDVKNIQPSDPATVGANLKAHFDGFVAKGLLSRQKANAMMDVYNDPAKREVFTDNTGKFNAHLMASVLANAGTVTEDSIDAIINGKNITGKPAKVMYTAFDRDIFAETTVENGRVVIRVKKDRAEVEPFQVIAPIVGGHEILHEDSKQGQDEEVLATSAEMISYAQQLLASPALATSQTPQSKINNVRLLVLMNSGMRNYPFPGLLQAPLPQNPPNVLPGGNISGPSMDWIIRNRFYKTTPDVNTPGNPYLNAMLSRVTNSTVTNRNFDDATITVMDSVRALSPEDWLAVARAMQLKLAS